MTVEMMLAEIERLPVPERKRLIGLIVASLPEGEPIAPPTRSITELRGLGKALWTEIDAAAYVDAVRRDWDERG